MIRDQRHMEARDPEAGIEEIQAAWREILFHPHFTGFQNRPERDHRTEGLEDCSSELSALAYVNENRWVCDCPADDCNAGIAVWAGNPQAACFDCGRIISVQFPLPADIAKAEEVLLLRPQQNRNWFPDKEKVDDLKVENLTHGFSPVRGGGA